MRIIPITAFLLFFACGLSAQLITADIDLNVKRSIDGVERFDRDVFVNVHTMSTENQLDAINLRDLDRLNISFGRAVGGVTYQMNRLNQDPNRPGFFDLGHMQQLGQGGRDWYNTQTWRHPYESTNWVMTSHISPTIPNGANTGMGWAPAGKAAIGQFYANMLNNFYRTEEGMNGEPQPTYLEVVNEPFIHAGELGTTNLEISRLHGVVADSVHARVPGVQVGGFTGAWPEFERANFGIWNDTWRVFIDEVGDKMDFFSLHIYDVPRPGADVQRKGANLEAILDMIEAYSMIKLGQVKPFVISEYGSCCGNWDGPYYEERDWLQLRSLPSMTMAFMERPHLFRKAVPFVTGKAQWYSNSNGFPYPHNILNPKPGGGFDFTHLEKYYRLLANVEGTRLDTYTDDPDLILDAYSENNKVYVLLSNHDHKNINVSLSLLEQNGAAPTSVKMLHLYAINDIPQLDESEMTVAPEVVVVGREGAMVLEYTFPDSLVQDKNHFQSKYYADTYLQPIQANGTRTFNIDKVSVVDHGEAYLRLGLGRDHGRSLRPTVMVNGTQVNVPQDWRGYDQRPRDRFFGLLEIPVPYELLQTNNDISVRFSDAGGHISSVALDVRNFDFDQIRTDVRQPLLTNSSLQLFPNPASDVVSMSWDENVQAFDVTVFDITGRVMLQQETRRGATGLNVQSLVSGTYVIRAAFPEGIVTRRLVVK